MALENRDGRLYYYRSVRRGEKVRRVYIASGELAILAHEREIKDRAAEEQKRREETKDLEHLEVLAAPVLQLDEAAEVLARAHLVAAGYRRYQGKWRRVRDRSA